jgi:uncharacterized protein YndB with AHSA1/START domain
MSRPSFVYVSYIATTRDKLWAALTDAKFTREYWGGHEVESDWKVGSKVVYRMAGADRVHGTVLESEPGAKLVLTWVSMKPDGAKPATKVSFVIDAAGPEDVKLTVTHEEHEPGSEVGDDLRMGWPAVLSSLKTMLETGRGLDMVKRWSAAQRG